MIDWISIVDIHKIIYFFCLTTIRNKCYNVSADRLSMSRNVGKLI